MLRKLSAPIFFYCRNGNRKEHIFRYYIAFVLTRFYCSKKCYSHSQLRIIIETKTTCLLTYVIRFIAVIKWRDIEKQLIFLMYFHGNFLSSGANPRLSNFRGCYLVHLECFSVSDRLVPNPNQSTNDPCFLTKNTRTRVKMRRKVR